MAYRNADVRRLKKALQEWGYTVQDEWWWAALQQPTTKKKLKVLILKMFHKEIGTRILTMLLHPYEELPLILNDYKGDKQLLYWRLKIGE